MAMFVVVFGMVMLGSSCALAEIPEHRVHDLPGLEKVPRESATDTRHDT